MADREIGPLEQRLDERTAERGERVRSELVGAAGFAERRTAWGKKLAYRNSVREELVEVLARKTDPRLASTRPIRYFSGPWNGDPGDLLPVSWFLLWRSNIDWVPDPASLERESDRRELVARRPRPEMVPPHRRERPADMKFKPARMRFRPRDVRVLRPIFSEKE